MNERASFGTRVHKEIENVLSGNDVWVDSNEMKETLVEFDRWRRIHELSPISLETTLYNDDLKLAGTADYVGFFTSTKRKPWGENRRVKILLDWKTSKAVFSNYHLQVSGYMFMYEQQYGVELDGCGVVAFRDGAIHEKYFSREEALKFIPVLRGAIAVYNWKYREGEWSK